MDSFTETRNLSVKLDNDVEKTDITLAFVLLELIIHAVVLILLV